MIVSRVMLFSDRQFCRIGHKMLYGSLPERLLHLESLRRISRIRRVPLCIYHYWYLLVPLLYLILVSTVYFFERPGRFGHPDGKIWWAMHLYVTYCVWATDY